MRPLKFQPLLKRIRWGGRRLGTVLGKPIGDETDYAESWEIADHGNDQSIVVEGDLSGWSLQRIVSERGAELFGEQAGLDQFPLLIKFLDAGDRLSVQVHPNDTLAKRFDPTENGKTEAWIIIHTKPGSRLYAGLKNGVDANTLRQAIDAGTIAECLHSFTVSSGDCVQIPAGTVHAIGEGILLAEIQQSSDLTFRLYDWDRLDSTGRPRELHIDNAFQCIDFQQGPVDPVKPHAVTSTDGCAEELVRSPYFVIQRHEADREFAIPADNRFHVLIVLAGQMQIRCGDFLTELKLGSSLLLPANVGETRVIPSGPATLIDTFLP